MGPASWRRRASARTGDDDKRPSVQVGDPFEEKRLIEACLEILDMGLVVGIQDLGAAGITGAASETSSKGGVGMDVYLSEVHVREQGMEPFEIMTSESQERMLAICEPAKLDDLLAICRKWEVQASVIGTVTGSGRFRVLDRLDGEVLADIPAASLDADAPLYDRPIAEPVDRVDRRRAVVDLPPPVDAGADLLDLLIDPSWVYRQYDHQLFLNTVEGPGGDATVLRLKHPTTGVDTGRGLALTCDGNHRWCALDPRAGTALVVAEAVMNLACVGARPLGLVNCLNFGNPEHPEVMWQLSEAIDGMGEACRAFGIPVVGGNVSLYNESGGLDIDPTPVVGLVGLVDRLARAAARCAAGRRRHPARARPRAALARRLSMGLGSWRARWRGARPRPCRACRGGRRWCRQLAIDGVARRRARHRRRHRGGARRDGGAKPARVHGGAGRRRPRVAVRGVTESSGRVRGTRTRRPASSRRRGRPAFRRHGWARWAAPASPWPASSTCRSTRPWRPGVAGFRPRWRAGPRTRRSHQPFDRRPVTALAHPPGTLVVCRPPRTSTTRPSTTPRRRRAASSASTLPASPSLT